MAYDFVRASSQSITSATSPISSITTGTLAIWVNTKNNNTTERVITVPKSDALQGAAIYLLNASNQVRGMWYIDPSYPQPVATVGHTINTWQHQCTRQSNLSSRDVYLNGGSKGSNTTTLSAAIVVDRIALAAEWNTSNVLTGFLGGRLAEAAIWSAALDEAEIGSLAKGFSPTRVRPQSLVFYAPLVRNIADYRSATALTNNNAATAYEHPRRYG